MAKSNVQAFEPFVAGSPVDAHFNGRWHPGAIVTRNAKGGRFRVLWPKTNEVATADNIRRPRKPREARAA